MNKIQILFLSVLGISILISYYIVLGKWSKQSDSYTTHPFWFGLDKNIVKILTIFQLLAVIGFLTGTISWLKNPPKEGIMSRQNILFLTIAVFFLSAALWPYTTYYKKVWLTVSVLIITAISCILLLAGSVEENNPRWYIFLGFLFLCITTVLGDGVIWNANYIKKSKI
jgi:predicted signal transduction protein with EAL and GGDEF domain